MCIKMRKKLVFAFLLFLSVEYFLRTFVEQFKYHQISFFMESVPIILVTLLICFLSRKIIVTGYFHSVYLWFTFVSVLGFWTAKTILFYQWYWVIHPEYKNNKLDINEGLSWTLVFSIIGMLYIIISYLIFIVIIKRIYEVKTN